MNFKIVENQYDDFNLEAIKEDYFVNNLLVKEIKAKYGLNDRKWSRVKKLINAGDNSKKSSKCNVRDLRVDTGIANVSVQRSFSNNQGFCWAYNVKDYDRLFYRDLRVLKDVVISRGLPWVVVDEELCGFSFVMNEYFNDESKRIGYKYVGLNDYEVVEVYNGRHSSTGVLYVYFNTKYWKYDNKEVCFTCKDLRDLKDRVVKDGLDWIVLDFDLVRNSFRKNRELLSGS